MNGTELAIRFKGDVIIVDAGRSLTSIEGSTIAHVLQILFER